MQLSDVSRTALAALRAHVIESKKKDPLINDPMAARLRQSQIALEVVTEKYTRGLWKMIVERKIKRLLGLSSAAYNFGVKNALELESYAEGIKVMDEWSYVEDPDVRPRILKYLGIARTQWTVTASIK